MEQRLKERLIGAAILVALAVWLIPWILDGRAPPQDKTTSVPLQLPVPKHSAPQRTQTIDLGDANDASSVAAGDGAAAAAAGPPTPDVSTAASAEESRLKTAPTKTGASGSHQDSGKRAAQAHGKPAAQPETKPAAQPETKPAAQAETKPAPAQPETKVAAAAPQTKSAEAPPAASSSGPEWMVQLGSFGEQDNAQRLAKRVAGVGLHAQISTHKSDGQLLYRVRVGPKATRKAAEETANVLSAHGFVAQVVTAD